MDDASGEAMATFSKITACLDMAGCPNRCRHCWLGNTPNGRLRADDLRSMAAYFRPFADGLEVASWYREPDYLPEYKELWAIESELSDRRTTPHWELMSVWRATRDAAYVPWLKSLGMSKCQLTVFGGREKTDYYSGRSGVYDEILEAIELLLAAHIAPRIQVFANQDNVDDLQAVVDMIHTINLEERCAAFGTPFTAFVHQGSCDGENENLYGIRVTPEDLTKIPGKLADYSLRHWGKSCLAEIFGQTEQELVTQLSASDETGSFVSDTPVFLVDKDFNVYPNITTPSPHWVLGNAKTASAEVVLDCYRNSGSPAQKARLTVPLGEMVKRCGDPSGRRLFCKNDYIDLILKRWCALEYGTANRGAG